MKRTVPFTKTITFPTMIAEITDIEVKHDLCLNSDNELVGNIIVDGSYKMTDASQIEEKFHYDLPFTISIDSKYDASKSEVSISDFYFEIINEEDLKLNIEVALDNLEEQKIEELELVRESVDSIPIPVETDEKIVDVSSDPLLELEKEIKEDLDMEKDIIINNTNTNINIDTNENTNVNTNNNITSMSSIFTSLANSEETFSTYYVYIVRENDTVDSIIDKYKVSKEELANYNNLNDIQLGSKLIIPCVKND